MCRPTCIWCWPACWAVQLLAASAIAMGSTLNAGVPPSSSSRRSSPLLTLHIGTLRLNPLAGQRPRYEMRAVRLVRVK